MDIQPFKVDVPEATLDDLADRLKRTRFADDYNNDNWEYGVNGAYLQELIAYWRDEYDWRQTEAEINAFPHFRTVIDDVPIHFIHVKGKGPNPKPIHADSPTANPASLATRFIQSNVAHSSLFCKSNLAGKLAPRFFLLAPATRYGIMPP